MMRNVKTFHTLGNKKTQGFKFNLVIAQKD